MINRKENSNGNSVIPRTQQQHRTSRGYTSTPLQKIPFRKISYSPHISSLHNLLSLSSPTSRLPYPISLWPREAPDVRKNVPEDFPAPAMGYLQRRTGHTRDARRGKALASARHFIHSLIHSSPGSRAPVTRRRRPAGSLSLYLWMDGARR